MSVCFRVLAWSVQAVMRLEQFTVYHSSLASKSEGSTAVITLRLCYQLQSSLNGKYTLHKKTRSATGKIIIYRERFMHLLASPKSLRNQLIIELPTLNAFRTTEVATVQAEHIDLDRGDIQVLDSKKGIFFTEPLDYTVARHLEQLLAETGITSGLVFKPGPQAGKRRKDKPLSPQAIEYIWNRRCKDCGIPPMPPRYGRAYRAVTWIKGYDPLTGHKIRPKSFDGLMDLLRHTNPATTLMYLRKICDYESFKMEFYEGMDSPFVSECARSDSCPAVKEGCYCRFFTPRLEAKAK